MEYTGDTGYHFSHRDPPDLFYMNYVEGIVNALREYFKSHSPTLITSDVKTWFNVSFDYEGRKFYSVEDTPAEHGVPRLEPTDPDVLEITYTHTDMEDNIVDNNLPELPVYPETEIQRHKAVEDIGALQILPSEILHEILPHLDIPTLLAFRKTNRRCLELVDATSKLQAILTHAQTTVRSMVAIGMAGHISCNDLYQILTSSVCDDCGDFGPYMYMLTFRRLCYVCFSEKELYHPCDLSAVRQTYRVRMDHPSFTNVPRMTVLPGTYSPDRKQHRSETLYDFQAILDAEYTQHPDEKTREQRLKDMFEANRVTVEHTRPFNSKSRRPKILQMQPNQIIRYSKSFAAMTRVPWLKGSLGNLEVIWGFHCVGCQEWVLPELHHSRMYTMETFPKHMMLGGNIINGLHENLSKYYPENEPESLLTVVDHQLQPGVGLNISAIFEFDG